MALMLTSKKEDHGPAHAYACYLSDFKLKSWTYTYVGARWELALAEHLGVHAQCVEHLDRVDANVLDDFVFDFLAGGLRIDAKSTMSTTRTRPNNMLVTTARMRSDVAYVLGDMQANRLQTRNEQATPLVFEAVGWEMGCAPSFRRCTFRGMEHLSMLDRAHLRSIDELTALVTKGGCEAA